MNRLLYKKLLLVITFSLALASCSQPAVPAGPAAAEPPEASSQSKPETPELNIPAENQQEGSDNANSEKEETPPELLYHINKAYRVVPNEQNTSKQVVLLTFDDGPKEQEMIDDLIDTLDKHGAKAIFFVNGYRVKEHPELLQLIAERDQIIGNHSWDHIDLKKASDEEIRKQIEHVQTIVKETTGEAPRFFRPPFGSGNAMTHQIAEDNDLIYMTWSNGSLDWDSKNKNKPEAVIANVMEQLHDGSNILMHELPWTVEALDELLTRLEQKGYGFVDPRSIGPAPSAPGA